MLDIKSRLKRSQSRYKRAVYQYIGRDNILSTPSFTLVNTHLYRPDYNSDFNQILLEKPFTFVGLALFDSFHRMI